MTGTLITPLIPLLPLPVPPARLPPPGPCRSRSRPCARRPEGLTAALLSAPSSLPVTVLEWLSHHLLYCAAALYSPRWDEQSRN